jgi:cyclin-dependent kinase 14
LTQSFPKLSSISYGEALASLCLKLQPNLRISAKDALKHLYFSDMPTKVFDLPNSESSFVAILQTLILNDLNLISNEKS